MKQKYLIIVFVVLLGVFFLNKYFLQEKTEKTFITDLIQADTARVDAIYIYPKNFGHEEVKLYKKDGTWRVKYADKDFAAGASSVQQVLTYVYGLTANRLVSKSNKNWDRYEVTDSLGTRVKVQQDGEQIADLVIGKFNYNQQSGNGNSFIRLYDQKNVYSVSGFLSMAFNKDPSSFRNNQLIYADKFKWNRVTFTYPGDSSFVLTKENEHWMVNGMPTDSLASANYLSSLSRLGTTEFYDEEVNSDLMSPTYSIKIEGEAIQTIELNSYYISEMYPHILTSSMNTENHFNGDPNDIFKRTFVPMNNFLAKK